MQATREALALCRDLGFALAGIADALPSRWAGAFRAWLDAGRHGSMAYLARTVEERIDPRRVLQGARSVIMVADVYAPRGGSAGTADRREESDTGRPRGVVARYARGQDYHVVMKRRLHRLCDELRRRFPRDACRAFVDTAPVPERELAARAGLGWIGKHTLLIHPRLGSWMLLGGVLTTLDLSPPPEHRPEADHCGTCTRCIDACPTGAITPYSVDASRCISYLTIERRGRIAPEDHAAIGDRLFGCDVCQEVCPHNRDRPAERPGEPHRADAIRREYHPRHASFDLLGVLGWTAADRARELSGTSLKRATLDMFRRNAMIVLGNDLARRPDRVLESRLRCIAADASEPELVRQTARDVITRIDARRG